MNGNDLDDRALSETDHYKSVVKRGNLMSLFLAEYNVDAFVATHLYGALNNASVDVGENELEDVLGTSMEAMSMSFVHKVKKFERQREQVKKLTPFQTYIALIKGYSMLSIMLVPKAFADGGYGMSSIFAVFSGCISCLGACMLVDVGLATNIYSYPLAVEKVLGRNSRIAIDFFIASTQFSIIISHINFLLESCKVTIDSLFDTDSSIVFYAIVIVICYTLMSWVRNLAKFSFTFMIGLIMLFSCVVYVSIYAVKVLGEATEPAPGIEFISPGYIGTLGFTIYMYEGIGIVMPIMAVTEQPQKFKEVLIYALLTFMVVYLAFAELTYFTWGTDL